MSDEGASVLFFLAVIVLAIAAWLDYKGVFFQTGNQWFQSCWTASNSNRPAENADEEVAWQQCGPVAERAIYNAGFVFGGDVGSAVTPAVQALDKVCPSNWTDVPLGGVQILAVNLIAKQGGPKLLDAFIPPDRMIVAAFQRRWPRCQAVRKQYGFPRVILTNGQWNYATPCKPCQAEDKATGSLVGSP
jgi:hypothetical protein